MRFDDDLKALLTDVRDRLARVEDLLGSVPEPCEGARDGLRCSLVATHAGWHLAEDGRTQWLDE